MVGTDNTPVKVGLSTILSYLIKLAVEITVGIYYIIGYKSLTSDLRDETVSKWLLSHIVFTWIVIGYTFKNLLKSFLHYDQVVQKSMFKKPFLFSCASFGQFITNCYFLNRFIKYDVTYPNSPDAQKAIDIIAIYFSVILSVIGFFIVFDCCCCCVSKTSDIFEPQTVRIHQIPQNPQNVYVPPDNNVNSNAQSHTSSRNDPSNFKRDRSMFESVKRFGGAILSGLAPTEEICTVCSEEFGPDDKWTALPCKHVFHPACIDPWIASHNNCPNCRAVVIPDPNRAVQNV